MISLWRGLPYLNRSEGVRFTTLTVRRLLQIVFPNGSIDPWHALGIVKNVSSTEQAIFIEGNFRDIPKNRCASIFSAEQQKNSPYGSYTSDLHSVTVY